MRGCRKVFAKDNLGNILFSINSVKETKEYFRAHGVKPSLLKKSCKNHIMVLNCFWEKDPDYEFSLPCTAFNPETGDEISYSSITKCVDEILGKDCVSAPKKISEAIKGGKAV